MRLDKDNIEIGIVPVWDESYPLEAHPNSLGHFAIVPNNESHHEEFCALSVKFINTNKVMLLFPNGSIFSEGTWLVNNYKS